jgi:CPA1 family monovalent cation:H+ antiporter
MAILMIVLLLFISILVSNIISHYIPVVPTALTQIAFGIIIALASGDYSFKIDAEWFMLLFIAPILYNDGRRFPRKRLWGMRAQILRNAFILVILTTISCGYVINSLIPSIPVAAAFALAAILSPTDPVAVSDIAKRIMIPEKITALVKGESLINDASGLVAFDYAITAVVTGYFSIKEAIINFSYIFLAGAFTGILLSLLITFTWSKLRKKGVKNLVLLQMLAPFVIYIITDQVLHASGIIAVVAAGIVHSLSKESKETIIEEEQQFTENIWSIVSFVLNGFVFVLLGMSIPSSMITTISDPNIGNWLAFGYIIVISLAVLVIRFAWSIFTSCFDYYTKGKASKPKIKTTLITTLSGVRGAVTMVGVLTIPFYLENGKVFPERSLLIFIAAGVILFLLILATVFLPMLSKKESPKEGAVEQIAFDKIESKAFLFITKKMKNRMYKENKPAGSGFLDDFTIGSQKILYEQEHDNQDESL